MSGDADARIAAASGGDEAALTELLRAHEDRLRQRVRALVPERLRALLDADDVVQETMTDAFLSVRGFAAERRARQDGDGRGDGRGATGSGDDAFAAWLWTLARHNLVDAVRLLEAHKRGGGRRGAPPRSLDDSRASLCDLLLVASITQPGERLLRAEREQRLQAAIAALPEPHRTVITRYDLQGEGIDALAEALGRSPGAVYLLRNRAHKWLRERLLDSEPPSTATPAPGAARK
ncbi:MAG: RNA polymerase sigma factor [Planctomycetota bacterium]